MLLAERDGLLVVGGRVVVTGPGPTGRAEKPLLLSASVVGHRRVLMMMVMVKTRVGSDG